MDSVTRFTFTPKGPFNLANQNSYFGGWLSPADEPETIVIAFPVEGWQGSAAVFLKQTEGGKLNGRIFCPAGISAKAKEQALASLSLDVDAAKWPDVGKRDPVIGQLQKKYDYLRPVLFHSPYEAAAAFIIGHRISIKQRQALMQRMAQELGEKIEVDGQGFYAFPSPGVLLSLEQYRGLNEIKIGHLKGIAQAALDGLLDRRRLRALPVEEALVKLRELPGIGPFFSQGILHRGAGLVDAITDDDVSQAAIQKAYQLPRLPDRAAMLKIAEPWQPFRMWALVLLHVWLRREVGLPSRRTFSSK